MKPECSFMLCFSYSCQCGNRDNYCQSHFIGKSCT